MPMDKDWHDREQDDDAYRENNRQYKKYACDRQAEEERSKAAPCVVKKAVGDRREGYGFEDEPESLNNPAGKDQGRHGHDEHKLKQYFDGHAVPNKINWQLKQRT